MTAKPGVASNPGSHAWSFEQILIQGLTDSPPQAAFPTVFPFAGRPAKELQMKKIKNIAWRIVLLPPNVYLLAAMGIILLGFRGSTFSRQFTPKYFECVREVFSVTGR